MPSLYKLLQRKTSNGRIIPEIDGLRFIAIFSVILYHLLLHFDEHSIVIYKNNFRDYSILKAIASNFNRGVQLFFAISGFILTLPFATHFLNHGKKPELKKYFLRRVTRLEPPYILALILFFILNLITRHNSFEQLTIHFIPSLFYIHNIVFPGQLPLINGVLWTLEIEIQFYVIAPLLCSVFAIKKQTTRILILSIAIIFFGILNCIIQTKTITLFNYIHFFLCGFLIADFYVTKRNIPIVFMNRYMPKLIFMGSLYCLFFLPNSIIVLNFVLPSSILLFFVTVLNDKKLKNIMATKVLTSIGGMCYSIYLLHMYLIAIIDSFTLHFHVSTSYILNFIFQCALTIPLVLLISSFYFVLVEKPCMDKNWLRNFFGKVRPSITKRKSEVKLTDPIS